MGLHARPLQVRLLLTVIIIITFLLHFRSLRVKYFGDVKVNGINTMNFEAAEDLFDLTTPNNMCYCHKVRGLTHKYLKSSSH